MHTLLNTNGKLVGLLFNQTFETDGPPFGGNQQEYEQLFTPKFNIKVLALCYNSFIKRAGTELFINFEAI